MLAYLAVGAALFAYMYLRGEEIKQEHAQVVQKAVTQANQSASTPALATTPVVIAPPNPAAPTAPTGQDNAIAVYSTPATPSPFDATATNIVPPQPGVPGTYKDVAPASDTPDGRADATPIAAVATVPPQPVLTADPSTPPLQAAMAQQAAPSYTSVVQPSAPPPPPVGDSLTVYTSKAVAPSETDPSPNQPIDTTPVTFVQPMGGPYILQPSHDCRR